MELSVNELSFAFLIESHHIACNSLSGLLLQALKTSISVDWKKKICAVFKDRTRQHVERCLEDNQPLSDIYVVCKLISCRINDISRFSGGALSDSREKERLSLQAQGVLAVRNWAYHGEFVSLAEVSGSVTLLILMLRSLRRESKLLEDLLIQMNSSGKILRLISCRAGVGERLVRQDLEFLKDTILRTLLYGSFASFQHSFQWLFGKPLFEEKQRPENMLNDFTTLVRKIKEEICKPRKESLLRRKVSSCGLHASLECLRRAKNKLAHNGPLPASEITEVIGCMTDILQIFDLESEQLKTFSSRTSVLRGGGRNVACILRFSSQDNFEDFPSALMKRQRLLRPMCSHNVGRIDALNTITTTLTRNACSIRTVVLVFGSAGIGKSHLATNAVFALRERYPRQAWISCSSEQELTQDITTNKLFHTQSVKNNRQGGSMTREWLVVLDDVRSKTVYGVYQKFLHTGHAFIITTRSSTVKELLQRTLPSMKVVHLRSFTEVESWQLIRMKTTKSNLTVQTSLLAKTAVTKVLGNLPLCVSIYSSLLAFACKTAHGINLPKIDSSSLISNWEQIEERFGDCIHVRGITGIVQSAGKYLQDRPMVLLLLAKICSTGNERIPWNVLKNIPHYISLDHGKVKRYYPVHVYRLLYQILGVTDYLFSETGQDLLEVCRGELEELGLIRWNNETQIVNVHCLTLHYARNMLTKRNLYLGSVVASLLGQPPESTIVEKTSRMLSRHLAEEVLIQVIYKAIFILYDYSTITSQNVEVNEDRVYMNRVYSFLSICLAKSNTWKEKCYIKRFANLCIIIIAYIMDYKNTSETPFVIDELKDWLKIGRHSQVHQHRSSRLNNYLWAHMCVELAQCYHDLGQVDDAIFLYERGLSQLMVHCRSESLIVAKVHCLIAKSYEVKFGPITRNNYLLEVLSSCPKLLTGPTVEDIKRLIANCQEKDCLTASSCLLQIEVWFHLLCFRKSGFLHENSEFDDIGQDCLLQLAAVSEQAQAIIQRKLEGFSNVDNVDHNKGKCVSTLDWLSWIHYVKYEMLCNELGGKRGRSLRSLLRADRLMKEFTLVSDHVQNDEDYCGVSVTSFYGTLLKLSGFCIETACSEGHYSLMKSTVESHLKPKIHMYSRYHLPFYTLHSKDLEIRVIAFTRQALELFNDSMSHLYITLDFHLSLKSFVDVLQWFFIMKLRFDNDIHTYVLHTVLTHISSLCTILGRNVVLQVLNRVTTFINGTECIPLLKTVVEQLMEKLNTQQEITNQWGSSLLQHFEEARAAYQQKEYSAIHQAALKCLKELAQFGFFVLLTPKENATLKNILSSMLLLLALYLKEFFLRAKNFPVAEWFTRFRLCTARDRNWSFLVAVCGLEYVEFLKERERLSDALEECRLVERGLVEDFGEDYLEWLPSAPKATDLRQILEAEKLRLVTN